MHAFRGFLMMSTLVVVAMSGGVDSSVTAKLMANPSNVRRLPIISHHTFV